MQYLQEIFQLMGSGNMHVRRLSFVVSLGFIVTTCAHERGHNSKKLSLPPHGPLDLARAESIRTMGVPQIAQIAEHSESTTRRVAIRALGRIGSRQAKKTLKMLLSDRNIAMRAEAAFALSMTLDTSVRSKIATLVSRVGQTDRKAQALTVKALGRIGTRAEREALTNELLNENSDVREAAGIAFGLYGRRRIPLSSRATSNLAKMLQSADRKLRYAAAYAFAREESGGRSGASAQSLAPRREDDDPEVRSLAVFGLTRRGLIDAEFLSALRDPDWRVQVQAIRALVSAGSDPKFHEQLATWAKKQLRAWSSPKGTVGVVPHPLLEASTGLLPWSDEPPVAAFFEATEAMARKKIRLEQAAPPQDSLWGPLHCTAVAARLRSGVRTLSRLRNCGHRDDPSGFARAQLLGDVIRDSAGIDPKERLTLLRKLFRSKNAQEQIAAISSGLASEDAAIRTSAEAFAIQQLAGGETFLASATIEAIISEGIALTPELQNSLLHRANNMDKTDPELHILLLDVLRLSEVRQAKNFFERSAKNQNVSVRRAAQKGLNELFGIAAAAQNEDEYQPTSPPPLNPEKVLDHDLLWTLNTSQGTVEIELWPQTAPWAVAAITELSQQGRYDNTLFHRVVPDFVVQGGDPTGTGFGGPNFVLPAEPSAIPFERGVVGIADAGLDTGGSQFFIMHSRAPHLEGRYTAIGRVRSGMETVDRLIVGSKILSARVQLVPISS